MKGIEAHPDQESQKQRFLNLGWEVSNAIDMNSVYSKVIPSSDVQRIEKLELFDEFEEWHLIQAHYCISMSVIENHRVQGLKNLEFLSATDG